MLWERMGVSDEEREEAVREGALRREEIQEEFGMTVGEYQEAVMEEFEKLRKKRLRYWSTGDLLEEAARKVEGQAKGV